MEQLVEQLVEHDVEQPVEQPMDLTSTVTSSVEFSRLQLVVQFVVQPVVHLIEHPVVEHPTDFAPTWMSEGEVIKRSMAASSLSFNSIRPPVLKDCPAAGKANCWPYAEMQENPTRSASLNSVFMYCKNCNVGQLVRAYEQCVNQNVPVFRECPKDLHELSYSRVG